jgi:hypothetical protein
MQKADEQLYSDIVRASIELHENLEALKKSKPSSIEDIADRLFAARESIKRLKEMASMVRHLENIMERTLVAVYLASSYAEEQIKTDYVIATPEASQGTNVPRGGSSEYRALLTHLGIPEEVQNHEVLKVHWPGWCSYYSALQARGESVPEEATKGLAEYDTSKVKTRKRQSMKAITHV